MEFIKTTKHKIDMFKAIRKSIQEKFSSAEIEFDEEHLMHLAAAALLLEVSRADFDIQKEELEEVAKALQKRFVFSHGEVQSLLDLALHEQDSNVSIYPFVKIINEGCSTEEKKLLISDLWRVAYADNKLDKYEEYQIRKIAELLYLTHSDFIQTKLKVLDSE